MRIFNNLIALLLILLIILSSIDTYEKITKSPAITGGFDLDTATVKLIVKSKDVVTEPVPISSGGGGGGGPVGPPTRPVNISKKILLELDGPLNVTMYAGDDISIFIKLKNAGDFDLKDILLTKESNAPDMSLIFSTDKIDALDIGEEYTNTLRIKSLVKPTAHIGNNYYSVTIFAEAGNFYYATSIRFFINLLERNYEQRLETLKQIQFADGFFNQTPNCKDIAKKMLEAWDHYENSEYDKAMSVVNSAMESCRDKLLPPEERKLPIVIPKTGMSYILGKVGTKLNLLLILLVLLSVTLLVGLYYYLKKREGKEQAKSREKPKTQIEASFQAWADRTLDLINRKDMINARKSYMQLNSIYETISKSATPVSIKTKIYVQLLDVRTALVALINRYGK